MNRREVLAAGSALATAGLAGCMGVLQAESSVDWQADYYLAESTGTDSDYALFVLGDVENTGGNHIETLDLTVTLVDENDQEITTRSKQLSKIRVGHTHEFHFRIGLGTGEASDFDDFELSPEVVAANHAPLANAPENSDE